MAKEVLLEVKDLRTEFFSSKKSSVTAVADVSFDINKGEILALADHPDTIFINIRNVQIYQLTSANSAV